MMIPRSKWNKTPLDHFCDTGTEKQVRSLLSRSKVSLPEVIGPASTFRGADVYLTLYRDFPRCFRRLEAMAREKGLID